MPPIIASKKCKWCSHAADIAAKAFYSRSDFEPWFQRLNAKGIYINRIQILGGEPFLNRELGDLCDMARLYASTVLVMSNMYWLKSEADIDKNATTLRKIDEMVVTVYKPIIEKCGGLENVQRLLEVLQQRFPHIRFISFTEMGRPIEQFGRIEFHHEPLPVLNSCHYVRCKNLMPDGTILGCCAMRRILGRQNLLDSWDIKGEFDTVEFMNWFTSETLKTCKYCSIATRGEELLPWSLV
jgi:hypothetical protein